MQPFSLHLPGDKIISGRVSIPPVSQSEGGYRPLLVLLHGGSYASDYYDASPTLSIEPLSIAAGIPVVSLDRPGYNSTTFILPLTEDQPQMREQAMFLNDIALPAIWEKYGSEIGASNLVLGGHSIGAMVAVITAGLYASTPTKMYPLSGLVASGITSATQAHMHDPNGKRPGGPTDASGKFSNFPIEMKDEQMIGISSGLSDPNLSGAVHARLNHAVPVAELQDVRREPSVWAPFTKAVDVPVLGVVGEKDALWDVSKEAMRRFEAMFETTRAETAVMGHAPHCIELSYQAKAVHLKVLGFALECATVFGLEKGRK